MLTIVIPSYNHAEFIVSCLDAALAVEPAATRVLIIDDGSPDNTMGVIQAYLETSTEATRVSVVSKKNSGLVNSLNLALSMVETELVYFIASDDVVIPEGMDIMLKEMQRSPELKFIIGDAVYFYGDREDEGPVYKKKHDTFFQLSPLQRRSALYLDYPAPILLQSTLFKTSSLREIGGWDVGLKWDDYPVFVKLFTQYDKFGKDFTFLSGINVVRYRQHDVNSYKDTFKQYGMVVQTLDAIAPEELRAQSQARALAFYILVALKTRDFRVVVKIIKYVGLKQFLGGVSCIPYVAYVHMLRDKL